MTATRILTTDQVRDLPTPESTRTWSPVPHAKIFDMTTEAFSEHGIEIREVEHNLTADNARYICNFLLSTSPSEEYGAEAVIMNSHDKSFAARFGIGNQVWACWNGMVFGAETFSRKHTSMVHYELPSLISQKVKQIPEMLATQEKGIEKLRQSDASSSLMVHDFVIELLDKGLLPGSKIKPVLDEFRNPSFQEFKDKNA